MTGPRYESTKMCGNSKRLFYKRGNKRVWKQPEKYGDCVSFRSSTSVVPFVFLLLIMVESAAGLLDGPSTRSDRPARKSDRSTRCGLG